MKNLESWFRNEEERDFVKRNIDQMILANDLVESMLRHNSEYPHSDNEFSYDNMENLFRKVCPECGEKLTEEDFNEDSAECFICPHCKHEFEDGLTLEECEEEANEVFQWYIVDSWLGGKLSDIGEVVLQANSLTFWGRGCCGQAVECDGTLQEVYRKLKY